MPGRDIVVIGASAGGVEALQAVVRSLPSDLRAAVFIVLHIPATAPSLMPAILNHLATLPASQPADNAPIELGHIYVALPDHHLLVERGFVRVVRGPRENRHRPAVDPLFRSAARAYGPRVIGVVLTGALDDGTAGLLAIKRRNGIAVVQDPDEALYASMPRSAIDHVQVDHIVPLAEIGPLLIRLVGEEVDEAAAPPPSEEMTREVLMAEGDQTMAQDESTHIGQPSAYSCPECGGVLWEIQDGELLRFRCRVGHALSADSVMDEKVESLEAALWAALNILNESISLLERMVGQYRAHGNVMLVERFEARLLESHARATVIRRVLGQELSDLPADAQTDLPSPAGLAVRPPASANLNIV